MSQLVLLVGDLLLLSLGCQLISDQVLQNAFACLTGALSGLVDRLILLGLNLLVGQIHLAVLNRDIKSLSGLDIGHHIVARRQVDVAYQCGLCCHLLLLLGADQAVFERLHELSLTGHSGEKGHDQEHDYGTFHVLLPTCDFPTIFLIIAISTF